MAFQFRLEDEAASPADPPALLVAVPTGVPATQSRSGADSPRDRHSTWRHDRVEVAGRPGLRISR
jgi:hypothetical protein